MTRKIPSILLALLMISSLLLTSCGPGVTPAPATPVVIIVTATPVPAATTSSAPAGDTQTAQSTASTPATA
ncbi:MAG: hypothetical protein J7M34_07620, partial [Anaerolineae bacterium]|nr:hypothetical protein [Anaerolineae bacterium]